MTLILEIAAGIVLGGAIIALIVAFQEALAVAVMFSISLAGVGAGIAFLYYVCGSWENTALVALALVVIGGTGRLIEFFNAHEKYGAPFRAAGDSIGRSTAFATSVSVLIWLPLSISTESWIRVPYQYILLFLAIVTFSISIPFFYKHGLRKKGGDCAGKGGLSVLTGAPAGSQKRFGKRAFTIIE